MAGDQVNIHIVGGTGYVGSALVVEAARRGHDVTSFSRNTPDQPLAGVNYQQGSVLDPALHQRIGTDADVVVSALAPRGDLIGHAADVLRALATIAAERGLRFGVVGGAGSLTLGADGPKVADAEWFPAEFRPEAAEMEVVLEELRAREDNLDWFYVSPPSGFGSWNPGSRTGFYRVGGEVLLTDQDGNANLSADDLAVAVLDELETPRRRRVRFSVAY
ncbi:NAD(P)-dependent oxidoreductase [Microbacterium sp. P05]|uniref:NAD(P)-dependent oxidoreductase n=1 Tax=Microbacterium sp. P05 TaxID=3366948 RepID=UPI003744C27C